MKCRDEGGLIVMPIFYDVEPSQVRNQKRKFGEAFDKQEAKNITKAVSWRKALANAANIAGWELKNMAGGHEAKAIKEIVDKIEHRLFHLDSGVNKDLVGMRVRLPELISRLEIKSDSVRMIGIWGIGGSGLPLALKVLGSFLYDKDENEWISALARLKDIPDLKIMDILRISYDGLETLEKELFLDIACFFRWESADITDEAMEILDACGFHPVIGIKALQQRALISIVGGKFDMHDLVEEMGQYIVRGEHPNNLVKHSRVWRKEEISNLCLGDATEQNNKIEVIDTYSYFPHASKIISTMKKLRWLSVYHGCDDEGPNFLSNELRYFSWRRYPASPFPDNFQPINLVVLKLDISLQNELWNGYKLLPHLKVLRLWNMENLLNTPDFNGLPCLQKLTLDSCNMLEEIHQSLGNHRSLEYIRVFRCEKLRRFPTILQMEKLKTLMLKYCNILEFPEIQGNMKSLEMLYLTGNKMILEMVIHQSIRKLHLRSLRKLHIGGWGLKDGKTPYDIGELSNLEELDLRDNDFSTLGFSLSQLTRLKILILSECNSLKELPELPSSIAIIEADNCKLQPLEIVTQI